MRCTSLGLKIAKVSGLMAQYESTGEDPATVEPLVEGGS